MLNLLGNLVGLGRFELPTSTMSSYRDPAPYPIVLKRFQPFFYRDNKAKNDVSESMTYVEYTENLCRKKPWSATGSEQRSKSIEFDKTQAQAYVYIAPAKSGAGIRTPNHQRRTSRQPCFAAFFVRDHIVLWWVDRAAFELAASVGAVVLTRSIHLHNEFRTSLVVEKITLLTEPSVMTNSSTSCALNVPREVISECKDSNTTLLGFIKYIHDSDVLSASDREITSKSTERYSSLSKTLHGLLNSSEEVCNVL